MDDVVYWNCKVKFYSIQFLCCYNSQDFHVYKLQYNPEGVVLLKIKNLCHHLLTFMSSQTRMTILLLENTGDVLPLDRG